MNASTYPHCIAFADSRRIASGALPQVALAVKETLEREQAAAILIFDIATSQLIELDLRGTAAEVSARLAQTARQETVGALPEPPDGPRGPGRPKLGVVAREVTLLPRHWDWLNTQPGGASVALRKLVEEARRTHLGKDRLRQAQEACYRFMSALAGGQAHFEEAARALFAGQQAQFEAQIAGWPGDVRQHAQKLAAAAFQEAPDERAA